MSKPRWRRCGVAECFRDRACHNELAGRDCLVKQAAQAFAYRISVRAQYDELKMQRALGVDWVDAYTAAWRVMDEVHDLVLAPERPAVYLPATNRTISKENAGWPI